jgi:hypothetical protein
MLGDFEKKSRSQFLVHEWNEVGCRLFRPKAAVRALHEK